MTSTTLKAVWKLSLLVAGVASCAMALYHFWLPHIFGWERFMARLPPTVRWGNFIINFCFSFLLLCAGLITMVAAFKGGDERTLSLCVAAGLAAFWTANALYQVIIPMPLPTNLQALRWGLLGFAVLAGGCCWLAVGARLKQ